MRETIIALSILILPALYLSGFFFAVRQILRSSNTAGMKALVTLGMVGILLFVSFASIAVLLAASGGYNH